MWNLIVDRGMPPTRKARYCCSELKESKGKGRVTITGVRWEESANRRRTHGLVDLKGGVNRTVAKADELGAQVKNNGRDSIILNNDNDASRQLVEFCFQKSKTTLNPIIDWTEEDVWEFLNEVAKVPHCVLYDQGWKRLGCIGCPMANVEERRRSFEEWPTYKQAYIRAFQKMIDMKSSHRESVLAGSIAIQDESGDTPAPEPRLPMETSAQQDSSMVLPPPHENSATRSDARPGNNCSASGRIASNASRQDPPPENFRRTGLTGKPAYTTFGTATAESQESRCSTGSARAACEHGRKRNAWYETADFDNRTETRWRDANLVWLWWNAD